MKPKQIFIASSIIALICIPAIYLFMPSILWILWIVIPIMAIGLVDILQTKHTIRRNFPVIGNFRYLLEDIRPEIMQYFCGNGYRRKAHQQNLQVTDLPKSKKGQ